MQDDIDRECCNSIEAALKIGIQPTYWNIIERDFKDPGMVLTLEWKDPSGSDPRRPQVKVTIEYGFDRILNNASLVK